jgi:cellulose synthase/poly-beta-1,6-N-acetylglucosamine synthase-like glycosyltransferase
MFAASVLCWVMTSIYPIIVFLVCLVTVFAFIRVFLLGALITHSALRRKKETGFAPPVAVLIPAYNESKVIGRTIDAVLKSNYPDLKIIVINDGSSDDTHYVVARMAKKDPRIRLISKPNGGKFSALNHGLREAAEEYIVTIDGDTLILPDTIRHLIAPFADPGVDAVCGNVQVGNVNNMLTRFQDVEYVTTQNYDRRAFEAINCITVVPGATGAWRKSTILKAGGYSSDTLTEDTDITLSLLRNGAKIVYAPLAKSITEAPETMAGLSKQRFRWNYGGLQCLWKHRGALGRGTLGFFGLPNMIYPVAFQLLGPVCDIMLLIYWLTGEFQAVAGSYLAFQALDLFIALVAYALDKRSMKSLWVVALHRLIYRPFLYCITIRATLAAFRGRRHGWNKLERQGTVRPVSVLAIPVAALVE